MITFCRKCRRRYDDEYRLTYCPHETFAANDGNNNFSHHTDAYLSDPPRKLTREEYLDGFPPHLD